MHSTGVILGKTEGKKNKKRKQYVWRKTVGPSVPFIYREEVAKHLEHKEKPFLFAVHTRHATVGEINQANAHPFAEPERNSVIVGMHNGTSPTFSDRNSNRTDSQNIIRSINTVGIDETIKKMDGRDAYALVWVDSQTDLLHIIRNHQRTLFFAVNKQGDTILWASERAMLEYAIEREHNQNFIIEPLEPHKLVTIDIHSKNQKMHVRSLSPWPKQSYSSGNYRNSSTTYVPPKDRVITPRPGTTSVPRIAPPPKKPDTNVFTQHDKTPEGKPDFKFNGCQPLTRYKKDGNVIHMSVEAFDNAMFSLSAFTTRVKKGCCLCDHEPNVDDVITREVAIHWLNGENYMCDSCYESGGWGWAQVKPQPCDRPSMTMNSVKGNS